MTLQISTSTQVIPLAFVEGQEVTLLAGAKVHGLITRCNQPGKVVHIQYSDEFSVIYVVAFGKLGMYAYVSADGLEAIAEVAPVKLLEAGMNAAQKRALEALAEANFGIYSDDWRTIDAVKQYAGTMSKQALRASLKALVKRGYAEWDDPKFDPWYHITDAGRAVLEAVVAPAIPLLDLYPEVDAADLLIPVLGPTETMELIGLGDAVEWGYALSAEPREGTVKRIYKAMFLVEFEFGATRWCFADEIKLILKAA